MLIVIKFIMVYIIMRNTCMNCFLDVYISGSTPHPPILLHYYIRFLKGRGHYFDVNELMWKKNQNKKGIKKNPANNYQTVVVYFCDLP